MLYAVKLAKSAVEDVVQRAVPVAGPPVNPWSLSNKNYHVEKKPEKYPWSR